MLRVVFFQAYFASNEHIFLRKINQNRVLSGSTQYSKREIFALSPKQMVPLKYLNNKHALRMIQKDLKKVTYRITSYNSLCSGKSITIMTGFRTPIIPAQETRQNYFGILGTLFLVFLDIQSKNNCLGLFEMRDQQINKHRSGNASIIHFL